MRGSDFEGATAGDEGLVFDGVFDGAEPVAEGVLDLVDGVLVRACVVVCGG